MNERTHPVTFRNQQNLRLFGIVHEPSTTPRPDQWVILLSPGIKGRVAPHQLNCKLAAVLVARGFRVLRFDFYGLGDSEGRLDERLLKDLYGSIQIGRYVDDVLASMNWLRATHGAGRFIVGGLCGGALTGLLAAARDTRIEGVIGLGIPAMLDSSTADPSRFMTSGQLRGVRSRYLKKALDLESWLRLLTLKSDVRMLVRSLFVRRAASAPAAASKPAASNANPHFGPALLATLERGCPVLMAFSEADRLYWEFDEKFRQPNAEVFRRFEALAQVEVLKSANHVLTFPEWQTDMKAITAAWIDRHFADGRARDAVA
jgi:uncharacterized protein